MTTPARDTKLDSKDNDDAVVGLQEIPFEATETGGYAADIDQDYLTAPKRIKFFRGVLFQMVLFGALSFVGPAMQDAIGNLGGGGLSSPYLANLAQCLSYALGTGMTFVGGPVVNKIGIKWACFIAAVTFPLSGAGYYVRAKFKIDWFLLFARSLGGIGGGFLYVGETAAMMSYPHMNERGRYLGIWSAMRNSGSVMGGAINFATNHKTSTAGGIAWSTYLIFIGFECTGVFWAALLSKTAKVRRFDGTRIPASGDVSWVKEFKALGKHIMSRRVWLMAIPALYSFFYGGVCGTYLSVNFSVRSRALSSLVMPAVTIVMVILYGIALDNGKMSQKKRAWMAFLLWVIPQTAGWCWLVYNDSQFFKHGHRALDYGVDRNAWAKAYFPYLIIFSTGYWCQLSIYWILGTFSTDVKSASRTGGLFRSFETIGQAISYGVNSKLSGRNFPLYMNVALLVLTVPCMIGLIGLVPDKPKEHDDIADEVVNTVQTVDK